ncbi:hypothetical protein QE152_g15662 [Popillia japonica]|uniref:Peptidase A2 domain-containing protein n=1 Tax=Popillia japonica TaxID=7064 RepID=A0AAW1L7R8_POPJA
MEGTKAAKSARENYDDNTVGYVQINRDGDKCIVKGKVSPEHKKYKKNRIFQLEPQQKNHRLRTTRIRTFRSTRRTGFSNWSLSRRTTASEQPELEHLEFNHQHAIRLPYIIIPEINAKLLIDTGASASSISTKIAESEFPEYILYSPFTVTTMHGTTQHNYILEIPSLATFNAYGQTHKFNIVDFSRKYDGILGLKLLEQMGAVIDFKQKVLRTKFTEIPLHLEDPTIHIGPRERKIVRLPVDRNLQEVLITHQEIAPGVEIPENITISEDYHVITELI